MPRTSWRNWKLLLKLRLLLPHLLSRLPLKRLRLLLMKWLPKPRPMLKLELNKVKDFLLSFWKKSWLSWQSWRINWLDMVSLMISLMMFSSQLWNMPLRTSSLPLENILVILLTNWNQLNIWPSLTSWKLFRRSKPSSMSSKIRLLLVRSRLTLLISFKNWRMLLMLRLPKLSPLWKQPLKRSRLLLMKWLLKQRLMLKLELSKARVFLVSFWQRSLLSLWNWRMTWLGTTFLMISSMTSWSLLLERPSKISFLPSKNILVISLASLCQMNMLNTWPLLISLK